jgi:hypothetical protein
MIEVDSSSNRFESIRFQLHMDPLSQSSLLPMAERVYTGRVAP